ncbi:hypothetical protein CRYUN_Cryun07bG0058100 [Craigia yunnanensis]
MEKLDLRSLRNRIRTLGLVTISGALLINLYKGPSIVSQVGITQPHPYPKPSPFTLSTTTTTANNWIIGGLLIATACLSLSTTNIGQPAILKGYPSEITLVSFYCLFVFIQCTILALIAERNNLNAWKLSLEIELISVVYSAVIGSVVTNGVLAWCIRRKGPVFVAMFKPKGIAIAAFLGCIFLGDTLYIGSIIGAVIIVIGFYGVIWAQSKEEKKLTNSADDKPESSSSETPLLFEHTYA